MIPIIAGLDLATHKSGAVVGDGHGVPHAEPWLFTQVGEDLGELGHQLQHRLVPFLIEHGVTHLAYEGPILKKSDKVLTLRKLYGLGFLVETLCRDHRVIYREVTPGDVKYEMTGYRDNARADKVDMIRIAERLGIVLPVAEAHGRSDVADAGGVWKVGVRTWAARDIAQHWDIKVIRARTGFLL